MQSTSLPTLIPIPFANTGGKNIIPNTVNPTPGGADFPNGFGPLTRTPIAAGGIPPSGLDMNGILNTITAIQQWQCAGGYFKYDSAFSALIGGYPKYAVLTGASGTVYVNQVENNTTNPESSGIGWAVMLGSYSGFVSYTSNTTLNATHSGMLIAISAAGVSLALPAANSVKQGATVTIIALNNGFVTSANNIVWFDMSITSITMLFGETCEFTSNGTNWYVSGGGLGVRPLGVHQTWQDVSGARALGATYTNNAGRPIVVTVSATSTVVATVVINIDGVQVAGSSVYNAGPPAAAVTAIVPAGALYRVLVTVGTGTLQSWTELR